MDAFCFVEGMIEKITDGEYIIVMFNRPGSVFRIYKGLWKNQKTEERKPIQKRAKY